MVTLNLQDWIDAISCRTNPPHLISGIGGSTQDLQVIKQMLTNGHVLTFGTFVASWVYTTIKNDPSSANNPFAGQYAASWVSGSNGPHLMTIVGYNDDLWIDVNGNGSVDSGEKGAFLVANSWSANWANKGFIWISYDAFLASSAVPNGPKVGRVAAGEVLNSYVISVVPKAHNYSPKLIAEFSVEQTVRSEIAVAGGISNPTQTTPAETFECYAIAYQGGIYGFNGEMPASATATFAFDLTDLLPAESSTDQRIYLVVSDNSAGDPTTLSAFTLIDNVHKTKTSWSQSPLVFDNEQIAPFIDYNIAEGHNVDLIPPVVGITSPENGAVLSGTVEITIKATDNVGVARVELFVDSTLYATDQTAPYLISLDTTKLPNGLHKLTAVAYDTSNNTAIATVSVNIQN